MPHSLFPTGRVAFAPLGNRLESCLRRGRLMEPERGRTGALLQKGRKRRRAPGKHIGAAEARRARSEPEERRPGAKKARLSTFLLAENHGQLCELLKYAVLGKSSVPKPRGPVHLRLHTG
ncbi:RNA exonuclease 5-like [Equus asinus]|uniref:RNA exonuclease 5-like n=1 Tax=Equus asinus TaxID=9793 RepID=UPI0038F64AEA